jgi:hypothetical protein
MPPHAGAARPGPRAVAVWGAALPGFRRYRREPAGAGDEAPSGTAAAGQ